MKNPPPNVDAHVDGTKRGEEWVWEGCKEPGWEGQGCTSRDAIGINVDKRAFIDLRMFDLPLA